MDPIRQARRELKWVLKRQPDGDRCACGEHGVTDLGHIVYTRHPDMVELYHPYNMVLLHNQCNINERAWVNVNACLMLLERAGGPEPWKEWALTIPRRGEFWIPFKMMVAEDLWNEGGRPFEFDRIKEALESWGNRLLCIAPIGRPQKRRVT